MRSDILVLIPASRRQTMRGPLWLALWLPLLVLGASATPRNDQCVTAVYTAYGYIGFAGFPAKGFWNTRCQNALEVTSIYAASEVYCSPAERTAGLAGLAAYCREYAGVDLIPREQLAENLTEDAIHRMRIVEYRELPKKGAVDAPVLISEAFYQVTFRTLDAWQFETWSHYAYGYAGYAFWAGIIAIGTLHRVVCHFIETRRSHWGTSVHPRSHPIWSPFWRLYTAIQTHILVPSPIPSRGRHFLCWTFPTRVEALVVLLFWILSTVFCAIGYRLFSGNLYWPETSAQLLRYVADRTGILSFANFPLIWLFSGRNNVFLWATGWSFATFNLFHRHVAWIATIQGVVHTVLFIVMFIQNGNAWRKMQKPYLFWGTVGMVAMILVLPLAMDFFRHRSYECFLVLHILLSVATLVGCFYHTIIFEGQEYWVYLWPAVGLWALDRGLRLVRMIYCNLHVHLNIGQGIKFTRSTATYDRSADVIRLEVFPGSKYIRPTPGQYYFLYQPFRLTGWECHPFTLGSWAYEDPTFSHDSADFKDDHSFDVSQVPLLSDSSSNASRSASRSRESLSQPSQQRLKLVFWIRPFDGWTRSLRQQCMRSPNRSIQTTLLLEGPYGEHFPLSNYESVLLVVGGTGIAAAVPYIQDHLMQSAENSESVKPLTRDIHLVWTTRQEAFIRDVVASDLQDALGRTDFNVSFYVTTRSKHHEPDEDLFHEPIAGSRGQNLDILQGRPDLRSLISSHAQEAQLADCSAAVMVCGPPAMADEARSAVHATMLQGYDRIRYIEESFSW